MNSSQLSMRSGVKSVRSITSARSQLSSRSNRSRVSLRENKEDRFSEMYGHNNKKPRAQSSRPQNQRTLAMKKFEQLDKLLIDDIAKIKTQVKRLNVDDYKSTRTLTQLDGKKASEAVDAPIRVLDSLIENEEKG